MTNLEIVSHYLKIEICCNREKGMLMLFQIAYLKMVLKRFSMAKYNSSITPINSSLTNTIMPSFLDYQATSKTLFWYLSAIRSLMYAMTMIQPDIVFALSIISSYCNNPNFTHVVAVIRILQYIKDILYDGIIFYEELNTKLDLIRYTDADYGSVKKD